MPIKIVSNLIVIVLVVLVVGCEDHEITPASPMKVLPAVERKVLLVKLDTRSKEIFIPRSAIVNRGGVSSVFEVRDQLARIRVVRLGISKGNKVQVISGLGGGETILSSGLKDVFDGSPISTGSGK